MSGGRAGRRSGEGVTGRIKDEFSLLQLQWAPILGYLFIMLYGALMVFRNIAFYRYPDHVEEGLRLRDLGYEWIPELPEGMRDNVFVGLPMWMLTATFSAMLFCAFFGSNDRNARPKPYAINMARRTLEMLAIGHTLRFFTYLVTTVPGSGDHCFGDMTGKKPGNMIQVLFTRVVFSVDRTCGDLMFSGHILTCWIMVLVLLRYSRLTFRLSVQTHTLLMGTCGICALSQVPLVIAARHHYSMDVVAASYVTPLLWHWHSTVWLPADCKLPSGLRLGGRNGAKGKSSKRHAAAGGRAAGSPAARGGGGDREGLLLRHGGDARVTEV